jgi:hypothetical protein
MKGDGLAGDHFPHEFMELDFWYPVRRNEGGTKQDLNKRP